jgi:hypothetical protein
VRGGGKGGERDLVAPETLWLTLASGEVLSCGWPALRATTLSGAPPPPFRRAPPAPPA